MTSFPHDLPSWLAKLKREEPLLILVQTTSIPASAVDKGGNTPAQYAKRRGYGDLAAMLLEAEQAAALK